MVVSQETNGRVFCTDSLVGYGSPLDPTTGFPAGHFTVQHIMGPDSNLNVGFIRR
jgi:hypothetical protein